MDAGHLIAFNLTLLAALISPGPAMLVALRTSLTEGRRAGDGYLALKPLLDRIAATVLAALGRRLLFQR